MAQTYEKRNVTEDEHKWGKPIMCCVYLQIMAPLPPQFLHPGVSSPSTALAFGTTIKVAEVLIKARVEHIDAMHLRREVGS